MRVISWNCNGAFRKKYKAIQELNSDIYIIQECENPAMTKDDEYKKFASNYLWVGYKNKGLAIFAKDTISLKDNGWKVYGLEWFISCTINDKFSLLGLWGCGGYIEDIYVYLQIHSEKLNNILIGGDFNSNSCWDKKHKRRTHSSVVNQLAGLGLYSCYHLIENEVQGNESKPTFFLYKKNEKSYHIDYFFYESEKVNNLEIGKFNDWIHLSDHMPVILDIKDGI
ncbi:endonuclease/exonuclease/phosphatase family protein [Clostridium algidicarnis]|uniref:endonuclease/exonuclease/phosphatase family protein n=1 Tax=Clostridium algidicarnis TaxID=37659 RepID=UPI0016277BE9|nr:endonuclease/exonuclease/phosphatase family protein [Clostridium algidicarnis]MBB6630723.1 endonuclease/exonuclease/phosphatase family protein [Clostridium algidicarnis]MCB2286810.1 endonuclease/exonuclease/phosphatase family protein [Clostridium algidicarnis]